MSDEGYRVYYVAAWFVLHDDVVQDEQRWGCYASLAEALHHVESMPLAFRSVALVTRMVVYPDGGLAPTDVTVKIGSTSRTWQHLQDRLQILAAYLATRVAERAYRDVQDRIASYLLDCKLGEPREEELVATD